MKLEILTENRDELYNVVSCTVCYQIFVANVLFIFLIFILFYARIFFYNAAYQDKKDLQNIRDFPFFHMNLSFW